MAHPNYATAVQRRFRTEARIKGLIIALAAYGSGKPNLFTSGPEFKSSVFAVLGGKAAANKLMSQARNWKAPRDANDFKCFQFTSCVRLRLGLLSSTRSSMALTVGKVRAIPASKSASASIWPFTSLQKRSVKGGIHMPQRDNKTREVNISGARVVLMLAFAFLSVQLLIWALVRYWLFAP